MENEMAKKTQIVIVEELKVYAKALYCLFDKQANVELVKVIDHSEDLLCLLENEEVDIVLTDLDLRNMSGLEMAMEISRRFPKTNIIAFSSYMKPIFIQFAIYSGIKGFINKRDDFDKLLEVIQAVYNGGSVYPEPFEHLSQEVDQSPLENLSSREMDIARLMLFGRSNYQMSQELDISKKTVETHKMNIYKKLEINSVDQLRAITLKSPV